MQGAAHLLFCILREGLFLTTVLRCPENSVITAGLHANSCPAAADKPPHFQTHVMHGACSVTDPLGPLTPPAGVSSLPELHDRYRGELPPEEETCAAAACLS